MSLVTAILALLACAPAGIPQQPGRPGLTKVPASAVGQPTKLRVVNGSMSPEVLLLLIFDDSGSHAVRFPQFAELALKANGALGNDEYLAVALVSNRARTLISPRRRLTRRELAKVLADARHHLESADSKLDDGFVWAAQMQQRIQARRPVILYHTDGEVTAGSNISRLNAALRTLRNVNTYVYIVGVLPSHTDRMLGLFDKKQVYVGSDIPLSLILDSIRKAKP